MRKMTMKNTLDIGTHKTNEKKEYRQQVGGRRQQKLEFEG
jgi:hypothetical protein